MNYIKKISILTVSLLALFSCKKDALNSDVFVKIDAVQNISAEGAAFSASLLNNDNQKIYDYGFVWCEFQIDPDLYDLYSDFKYSYSCGSSLESESFNHSVTGGLTNGQTYYVRAYAVVDNYVIYSDYLSFVSEGSLPPVITEFTPTAGGHGTKVKISGKNFGNSRQRITVKFGNLIAQVDSALENEIFVTSPDVIKSDSLKISVEVAMMKDTSSTYFYSYYPWTNLNKLYNIQNGSCSFTLNDHCYIIKPNINYMLEWTPQKNSLFIDLPEKSGAAPLCAFKDNYAYIILNSNLYQFNFNSHEFIKLAHLDDAILNPEYIFVSDPGIYIGSIKDKYLVKLNLTSKLWEPKSPFANDVSKSFSSVVSCNNKAYMVGGDISSFRTVIYEYQPENDNWIYKAQGPYAIPWGDKFVINNKIYFNVANDIYEFDPSNDGWMQYIDCPVDTPVRFTLVCGNKGYVEYETPNGLMWEFDPSKN